MDQADPQDHQDHQELHHNRLVKSSIVTMMICWIQMYLKRGATMNDQRNGLEYYKYHFGRAKKDFLYDHDHDLEHD